MNAMISLLGATTAAFLLVGGIAYGGNGGFQGQMVRKAESDSRALAANMADKTYRTHLAHPHGTENVRKANADLR